MPLQPGSLLHDRYRIDKLLGQGGFGAVYMAWDNNLAHMCAVKENLDTSEAARRQFETEAKILAKLIHQNLPRVTDYFFVEGQGQYLVMDFVEGEDLNEFIETSNRPLPESRVLAWIGQVCDALVYLHSQNPAVIHRDIKPSNIKITPSGQAMLVDFGIAKVFDPIRKTTVGARAVTPGYSPVEQYGQGITDERTDIYALGATLYHLLTAQQPPESVQRMLSDTIILPQRLNPQLSSQTAGVILHALQLDPSKRFQHISEMRTALISRQAPVVSRAVPAPAPQPSKGSTVFVPTPQSQPGGTRTPNQPASTVAYTAVEPAIMEGGRVIQAGKKRNIPWMLLAGVGGVAVIGLIVISVIIGMIAKNIGGDKIATPTLVSLIGAGVTVQPTNSPSPAVPTGTPEFRSSDPTRLTVAISSRPDTLDPALDYESTGSQLLHNIYETLVFFKREEGSTIIPQLATSWEISADGKTYTFYIRQGVHFHDGSLLSAEDVAYSLQRYILQGGSSSPVWLLTEPLLGVGIYDVSELLDPSGSLTDDPDSMKKEDSGKLIAACQSVTSAIVADPATNSVTFHLYQPWAPFLVSLGGSWASIQSKTWVIANGGWNADCASWVNYYGKSFDAINTTKLGTDAMGSGPYKLDHWTKDKEIVLTANEQYWRTEPAWEGGPLGAPRIKQIIFAIVEDDTTRLDQLKNNSVDMLDDNVTRLTELDALIGRECDQFDWKCNQSSNPNAPLEHIHGIQLQSRYDLAFEWDINTDGNNFTGSGVLDGKGIPSYFFSDVHVRRAFAYCFNYQRFLEQGLLGEGIRSLQVIPPGLPGSNSEGPGYMYDPEKCRQEFQLSDLRSADGRSLMDVGYRMTIPYLKGVLWGQVAAQILQTELTNINPKFIIDVAELDSNAHSNAYSNSFLPLIPSSWIEDIHDPHNWAQPYTTGYYAIRQGLPQEIQTLFEPILDRSVATQDINQRTEIYKQFNQFYFEQSPAILLYMRLGNHYQQRWVNGWYYNPSLAGTYYYALWKD